MAKRNEYARSPEDTQKNVLSSVECNIPHLDAAHVSSTGGWTDTWWDSHAMVCTATGMNKPKPHGTTWSHTQNIKAGSRCKRVPTLTPFASCLETGQLICDVGSRVVATLARGSDWTDVQSKLLGCKVRLGVGTVDFPPVK